MGISAAVVGASGYAGGELLRLLLAHPSFDISAAVAGSNSGRPVTDVHPHLPALSGLEFAGVESGEWRTADVVFLALPHGESGPLASALGPETVVVDLGADHRLQDEAEWQRYYGAPYAGCWTYGLPELPGTRSALSATRRVAAPGCYPTAVTLALAPLARAGLVVTDDVVVVAASGTSGAGRSAKPHLLGSEVMGALSAYKVGAHQHTPEIKQSCGLSSLSFTPVLAPMPRGILATVTAKPARAATSADVREVLAAAYAGEPFVHLLPDWRCPHTGATVGSNSCHLQACVDADSGRVVVVSAIDNLGKGAAGQAVQCANVVLGLPETAGLTGEGVAP